MEEIKTIEISQKLFSLIAGFIAVIAVFMIGELLYQFQSLPQNSPHEINVTGEGKAFAKPDVAIISFGVTSQASKSQDAVNQNNEKMNAIIKAIKDLGVQDKDIQTTFYNLNPVYGPDKTEPLLYPYPVFNNKIVGYSLEQQVQVKIRDFDKINDVLDQATSNGANTVGNLQFTVDDIEKVREEARAKAIEQAKEKATNLARQSGLRIERIVNISEGYSPFPIQMYDSAMRGAVTKESIAPQIQSGQIEVNTTVTLTYKVR